MGSEALMEKVRQLKKSLEEIERRLAAGELPRGALAEQVKQLKQLHTTPRSTLSRIDRLYKSGL